MKTHPAADLFPLLEGAELKTLANDIKERGLVEPVWVMEQDGETLLLDGRNRVAACQLAGVAVKTQTYDGSDPIGFVVALNIMRRHLTAGQRGFIAVAIKKM
jgi:ParB-like chromosome segregation protein Spo0J